MHKWFFVLRGYSQCSWGFRHRSVRRIHTFIDFVENMKFM
ncbi:unnamed protein product [Brassica napus]|uniref:(rape) hypothetical protein n=1 Tax=Brassica napus TaxID=3708 RepID=A0A816XNU0_BRANA|nr:unnamed protein product [Brassica napus]